MPFKITFNAKAPGQKAVFKNPETKEQVTLADGESITLKKDPKFSEDAGFSTEKASLTEIAGEKKEETSEPTPEEKKVAATEDEPEAVEVDGSVIAGDDTPVPEAKPKKKKKKPKTE